MYLTVKLKRLFKEIGITIDRYPTGDLYRRMKLINYFNINKIYDVGANKGQYAQLLRKLGYKNQIISFEPLKDPYKELQLRSKKDNKWEIYQLAMGDDVCYKEINVSRNSVSSSFQDMLPVHIEETPDSIYVSKEKVKVVPLDSLINDLQIEGEISWLKIDTQGYEMSVLKGGEQTLKKVVAIQIELSLSQTYNNEVSFLEVINLLKQKGFKLFSIEPGYCNKTSGQLYQMDGIFLKEEFDQK